MRNSLDIDQLAAPLLNSSAFRRLENATFLGILSPIFGDLPGAPKVTFVHRRDGTRASHSIGVAQILARMLGSMRLSWTTHRYACAWALTHDLATWPLSHTTEASFSELTRTTSRKLRRMMIEGDKRLPNRLSIRPQLRQMRIDPGILQSLFDKSMPNLDPELSALWRLIHSPITPDTLEGMSRSAAIYGIAIPNPSVVARSLYLDMFSNVIVDRTHSDAIIAFWRGKSLIYGKHINSQRTIEFESAWTKAIQDTFTSNHLSLDETLELDERQIISAVLSRGPPRFSKIKRYKAPLTYVTSEKLSRRRKLEQDIPIAELSHYLLKSKAWLKTDAYRDDQPMCPHPSHNDYSSS